MRLGLLEEKMNSVQKKFRLDGGVTLEEAETFSLVGKTIQREIEEDVFKHPEYFNQWEKIIFFTDGTATIFMGGGVGVVETICCKVLTDGVITSDM